MAAPEEARHAAKLDETDVHALAELRWNLDVALCQHRIEECAI